jgi:hypothetical protein
LRPRQIESGFRGAKTEEEEKRNEEKGDRKRLQARWTAGLRPAVAPILSEFDRGSGVRLDA